MDPFEFCLGENLMSVIGLVFEKHSQASEVTRVIEVYYGGDFRFLSEQKWKGSESRVVGEASKAKRCGSDFG